MNTLELIRDIFHPNPYTNIQKNTATTNLHMSRQASWNSVYALLASEINESTNILSLIKSLRSELKQHYKARWILKEVGFVVVLIGEHENWVHKIHDVRPDWHGLHSVILQGMLFLDPKLKQHALTQSHWGPIKFGNFHGQIDKIHYLLGKINAEN